MGMVVRTNTMAVNANRQLASNNTQVGKSLEKLSSGFRINRAGDDASGLAISEKMKAQIKGLEQASANSQDGISLIQTAEGNLTEVHDMLNRMVELTEKSANGILEDVDRQSIQDEMDALASEIDRIADSANFNNIKLFDGSLAGGKAATAADGEYAKVEVDESMKLGDDPAVETVAATKSKFTITNTVTLAVKKEGKVDISYTNADGEAKTFSISLRLGDTGTAAAGTAQKVEFKIGDGEWTASSAEVAKGGANATDAQVATAIVDAVKSLKPGESEFADLFKVENGGASPSGALTFEAKEAGATKAKVTVGAFTADVSAAAAPTNIAAANTTTGTDAYIKLDLLHAKLFDNSSAVGTTAGSVLSNKAEDLVFTVDGQKFALVNKGQMDAAKAALGADVTLIETSATMLETATVNTYHASTATNTFTDKEIGKLVDAINVKLGYTAVEVDGTTLSRLNFNKAKPDTATSAAGNGLKLQIGDTNEDFNKLQVSMEDMHMKALFSNDVLEDKNYDGKLGIGKAVLSKEGGLDISTQDKAGAALQSIRKVIDKVSTQRGNLGALQNRLEHTINNLDVTNENMTAANSRIRDTDMAKEMMNYTKMNVLVQSAQAMLAQANQQPQSILQLLQ